MNHLAQQGQHISQLPRSVAIYSVLCPSDLCNCCVFLTCMNTPACEYKIRQSSKNKCVSDASLPNLLKIMIISPCIKWHGGGILAYKLTFTPLLDAKMEPAIVNKLIIHLSNFGVGNTETHLRECIDVVAFATKYHTHCISDILYCVQLHPFVSPISPLQIGLLIQ